MKDILENIINKAKEVSLSEKEKNDIKQSLLLCIKETPVKSPFFNTFFSRRYSVAIVALFLIFLGGGTSALAQKAIPGDLLYPIKIHFNESVESMLAFTPEQSAVVELNQTTRRLDEVEILVNEGGISSDQNSEIKNNISQKIDSIDSILRNMENKGNTESAKNLRTRFDSEIDNRVEKLSSISPNASTTNGVQDIVNFINNKRGKNREQKSEKNEKENSENVKTNVNSQTVIQIQSEQSHESEIETESKHESSDDEHEEFDDDSNQVNTQTNTQNNTTTTTNSNLPAFTMAQVATHNKSSDCYSAISGGVYNLTSWINQHPGGSSAILSLCGIDGTSAFLAQHSGQSNPTVELASLKIGILN